MGRDVIESIARAFHEAYERLAPDHGYETRRASAKPWEDVPDQNKGLMIAVVHELVQKDVIRISPMQTAQLDVTGYVTAEIAVVVDTEGRYRASGTNKEYGAFKDSKDRAFEWLCDWYEVLERQGKQVHDDDVEMYKVKVRLPLPTVEELEPLSIEPVGEG